MKLAVVTPWASPFIWTKFALNLGQMLARFDRPGWEADVFFGQGADPAGRHANACLQALEWEADVICIIGADQVHPLDMLNRLIDRYDETGGQIITALVPFRGYVAWQQMRPFQPMGWSIRSGGPDNEPAHFVPIDPADGDLQRVDIIGSGVLMFHRDFLLSLERPWFHYSWDLNSRRVADMDTRFVWRLRSEAGAEVWVDCTIKVKHIHPFEIDDSFSDRFADWAAPDASADSDTFRYFPAGAEE